MSRLADELSADDLQAAVANLRGVLAFRDGRFADAERIFHGVWHCPEAPPDRRAVSAIGLAVTATFGQQQVRVTGGREISPSPTASDDARVWIDRARETYGGLLEPLARHAVGVLLDKLDAYHRSGANGRGGTDQVCHWLSGSPSVLAAFR